MGNQQRLHIHREIMMRFSYFVLSYASASAVLELYQKTSRCQDMIQLVLFRKASPEVRLYTVPLSYFQGPKAGQRTYACACDLNTTILRTLNCLAIYKKAFVIRPQYQKHTSRALSSKANDAISHISHGFGIRGAATSDHNDQLPPPHPTNI